MSKKLTKLTGEDKWYEMSIKIEDIVTKEKGFQQMLISIQLLYTISLGIDHDLFTPIFAISRMSGWLLIF